MSSVLFKNVVKLLERVKGVRGAETKKRTFAAFFRVRLGSRRRCVSPHCVDRA